MVGKHSFPIVGLVLTGGKSTRMKKDKALINYRGEPHARHLFDLLSSVCDEVYLSAREGQWSGSQISDLPIIVDKYEVGGPINGILSAMDLNPNAYLMVVACDLVNIDETALNKLVDEFDDNFVAVAYKNTDKGFPEPLCTLYSPEAKDIFRNALLEQDIKCPVKVLKNNRVKLIDQGPGFDLTNVNTTEEYRSFQNG